MTSFWQKSLVYLGLVDEEQLDDSDAEAVAEEPAPTSTSSSPRRIEPPRQVSGRRVEPPASARPTGVGGRPDMIGSGASRGAVRPVMAASAGVTILAVSDMGDAKQLADRLRERQPVVLNLRETEPDLVRRVVDFASGLVYALDGTMRRSAEGVVIVLPPRTELGRDEKRRLADQGLYDLDT